jgi:hypothetical protein
MRVVAVALGMVSAVAGCVAARADGGPNFVIPGRPDVPIIINGINASYGVAESDFGLYRPGAVPVTIYPSPYAAPVIPSRPVHYRVPAPYYPSLGGKPYRGRLEIEPPANRPASQPAQSFHRSWSAESPKVPATDYAPSQPMLISPEINLNSQPLDGQGENGQRPKPPPIRPPNFPPRRR